MPFTNFGVRSMQLASVLRVYSIALPILESAFRSLRVSLRSFEKVCLVSLFLGLKSECVWMELFLSLQLVPDDATSYLYAYCR
jgi:hypothetical protein